MNKRVFVIASPNPSYVDRNDTRAAAEHAKNSLNLSLLAEAMRKSISNNKPGAKIASLDNIDKLDTCFRVLKETEWVDSLFDEGFYSRNDARLGDLRPYEHYRLTGWREGRSPHPLFDVKYYLDQLTALRLQRQEPLAHYLSEGWKLGLSPHPLFDLAFYQGQIPEKLEEPPLVHYLNAGWRDGLSPHPLFDPEHFDRNQPGRIGPSCPLVRYLTQNEFQEEPNYLFSDSGYVKRAHEAFESKPDKRYRGGAPLLHYIAVGAAERIQPHPLFDPVFYQQDAIRALGEDQDAATIRAIEHAPDLLTHYLQVGWQIGACPTRFFFPDFYRDQLDTRIEGDPLRHYLTFGGYRLASPHPGIDLDYYSDKAPGFSREAMPVLAHILATGKQDRVSPHPAFDPPFYVAQYLDIFENDLCPIRHFLEHGMREGRKPNGYFSSDYVFGLFPGEPMRDHSVVETYLAQRVNRRTRVLFVSHDASRTGAPAIILRLMQDFAALDDCECFAILDRGGERLEEFQRAGHTFVMPRGLRELGEDHEETLSNVCQFLRRTSDNSPVIAFVNSAESRHIGAALHRYGIPVVSLVHEIADFYDPQLFETIYRSSSKVVFPSQFVLDRARAVAQLPPGKGIVRGQGLLDDRFGTFSREAARRLVLKELNLPDETFLVLSCGTMDQRKGLDYFVSAAIRFFAKKPDSRPACFIWIGEGQRHNTSTYFFATSEIKAAGLEKKVRLIGARKEVERYFVAADAFLLTARADPFPCVVHEAMAARLPVIAFHGGGGAPELIGDDSGYCVPLGDTDAMAERLLSLYQDPEGAAALGAAGREKITQNWRSHDYFRFFADLASSTGLAPTDFGLAVHPRESSPKRVFFLQPDWSLSGVNSFTETLIQQLIGRGFDAKVLFTRGRFTHFAVRNGQPVLPQVPYEFLQPKDAGYLSGHLRTSPQEIWRLLRAFLKTSGPCIVVPNYDYVASALAPNFDLNVGVMGIAHSDHEEHYEHVYSLGRSWNRVVAVSQRIADKIAEDNLSMAERLSVIPYGVQASPLNRRDLAALKSKKKEPLHLFYAGRFVTQQKNIYEYVRLAKLLTERDIPFRLTMAGTGPEFKRVKAELKALRDDDAIQVTSRLSREEIAAHLATADIVLMLSDYEGLPLVLLEGMAAGCIPIVYAMKSGIPELIEDGRNGFIVEPGDLAALADKIQVLDKNYDARLAMHGASVKTIQSKHLRDADMGKAYADLFDSVFAEIRSGMVRKRSNKPDQEFDGAVAPSQTYRLQEPQNIWSTQLLT